jgi:NAD(P)-dependent dehydrogenase (short-subunit alcohol dehydrogenase family)
MSQDWVFLSCRLKLAEEAIKRDVPHANIHRLVIDLSSFANIRKAAAQVNANPEPLHVRWFFFLPPYIQPSHKTPQVLINNAAASFKDFTLTENHLEYQLATDHFGPFLFTKLLAPKLLAAGTMTYTPRVIFVSSEAHSFGTGVDFDALTTPDPAKYVKINAYMQAKSANILTAIELSKRSKGKINAYSLHPGGEFILVHSMLSSEM